MFKIWKFLSKIYKILYDYKTLYKVEIEKYLCNSDKNIINPTVNITYVGNWQISLLDGRMVKPITDFTKLILKVSTKSQEKLNSWLRSKTAAIFLVSMSEYTEHFLEGSPKTN